MQEAQVLLNRDQQAERAALYMGDAKLQAEATAKKLAQQLKEAEKARDKAVAECQAMKDKAEKAKSAKKAAETALKDVEAALEAERAKAAEAATEMAEFEKSLAQVTRERDAERVAIAKLKAKAPKFAQQNYNLGSDYGYRLAKRKVYEEKQQLSGLEGNSAGPDSNLSAVSTDKGEEVDGPEGTEAGEEVEQTIDTEIAPSVDDIFAAAEAQEGTEAETALVGPIADIVTEPATLTEHATGNEAPADPTVPFDEGT